MMREKNLKYMEKWVGGAVGGPELAHFIIKIAPPFQVQSKKTIYRWKGLFAGYKNCLYTFFCKMFRGGAILENRGKFQFFGAFRNLVGPENGFS